MTRRAPMAPHFGTTMRPRSRHWLHQPVLHEDHREHTGVCCNDWHGNLGWWTGSHQQERYWSLLLLARPDAVKPTQIIRPGRIAERRCSSGESQNGDVR